MIKTVVVIGAGTMGNGIAHTAAASGFPPALDVGTSRRSWTAPGRAIYADLQRGVDKGNSQAADEKPSVLGSDNATPDMADRRRAPTSWSRRSIENLEAKTCTLPELDGSRSRSASCRRNTSSISITKIAAATKRAGESDRDALHESGAGDDARRGHPRPSRRPTRRTAARTSRCKPDGEDADRGERLSRLHRNRVLMPMINEAIFALSKASRPPEAIDGVMKLGMNHPMGPLTSPTSSASTSASRSSSVLEEGSAIRIPAVSAPVTMVDAGLLGASRARAFSSY